jgi:protein involved in polysaccharide export with SLBB domain
MKKILFPTVAGLALTVLVGCATTGTQSQPKPLTEAAAPAPVAKAAPPDHSALLQPPTDLFTLGPGDRIDIEILGTPTSRTATAVGPDGKVYFHLLPGLDVWGLTLAQTKALLEKELAKYISDAQIAVTLRAVGSKAVWLLGRFAKPGIYPMAAPMTVLEAFALAGGTARSTSAITTEDLGDLRHSFVVRQGQVLPVDFAKLLREGDMTQNIYLKPDDFVHVASASAREIYVLGAVRTPHAIPFNENVTVISAIAGAYGTIKDAYLSHVAIVRGSMSDPHITIVDYRAIVTGKAPDVRLEPHDIVYVPTSPYRTLTKYLELVVATFANTVAANEGTLVVNPNASLITPTVPIGR